MEFFKPLADYLKSSQKEWRSSFQKDWRASSEQGDELERKRQANYEEGLHAIQTGNFEEAVGYLKKATTSRLYRKDAYYYLAECYQRLHMLPLARKTYERLMRLDYNFRDVQERIRSLDSPKKSAPSWQAAPTQHGTSEAAATTVAISSEDRYEILDTLHEGKHSRIYRVRDRLLERTLALKQIDRQYPDRTAYLQQMKERTAVEHPNILKIYDIDEKKGQIALEYVEGRDLRYTLRLKGALAPQMVIHIAVQLVNGLHQAHLRNIIHHALTPEHILLTRQCHLKIIAFRAPGSFMRLQKADDPYKYLYIPPELFRRGHLTVASNIYSFGVILYEMFVGKTPFRLRQIKSFVNHKTALEYDETSLPPGIRNLVRRCLAIAPEQRYPNIYSIGEELISWFKAHQREEAHDDDITTYKDYLLVAWADGKITEAEATFLAHKRQELHITDQEAKTAEVEVKEELKELLRNA